MFVLQIKCQKATWAEVGPKWNPRGSQNGAQEGAKTEEKKEKKNEVKLSRLKGGKRGVLPDLRQFVTRPLGERGETRGSQESPRKPKKYPKRLQKR